MPTPFELIPVLDLRGGAAVHARGGARDRYSPVSGRFGGGDDPVGLASALCRELATTSLYLADLDAIEKTGGNAPVLAGVLAAGLRPSVDLGLRHGDEPLPAGPGHGFDLVAGTETLGGPDALRRLVDRWGADRVVFSLDLRGGRVVLPPGADWPDADPVALASAAADCGVARVIVLDLSRVGSGLGPDPGGVVAEIKRQLPSLRVLAGGGVSGADDLRRLRDAGADGALLATALHDGRITAEDLLEFRTRP